MFLEMKCHLKIKCFFFKIKCFFHCLCFFHISPFLKAAISSKSHPRDLQWGQLNKSKSRPFCSTHFSMHVVSTQPLQQKNLCARTRTNCLASVPSRLVHSRMVSFLSSRHMTHFLSSFSFSFHSILYLPSIMSTEKMSMQASTDIVFTFGFWV